METAVRYFAHVQNKLQEVLEHELLNIDKAADFVVESCKQGGKFYVFGAGLSHMIAEELYLRACGLVLVHGILPGEMMLHQMPNKSTYLERIEGYAQALVCEVVDKLVKAGIEPPIFKSSNVDGEMNTTIRCSRSTMVIGSNKFVKRVGLRNV